MNRLCAVLVFAGGLLLAAPAFAQNDFSGEWAPVRNQDNSENPLVGDWIGIPLNEAGLARSEAWPKPRSFRPHSGLAMGSF